MFTPAIQLEALFVLDDAGRIVSTRELRPSHGPRFSLIRGLTGAAWAVRDDVPNDVASELHALAQKEPTVRDFEGDPLYARAYVSLVGPAVWTGPAFTFPRIVPPAPEIVAVDALRPLTRHFTGWTADDLRACAPIVAILEGGHAVSVCFCARRSPQAAEAGLETAEGFRGRGYGARVAAAWAFAIRGLGLLPLYSTSRTNTASLAVARKLGLRPCASDWAAG
jgi:hypothetical protein